jgi:hypothetical protein
MTTAARKPREDGPTALYELRSAGKELLYVGISHRPFGRWREHAKDKPWWPKVAWRSLIWFDSRAEALVAEQAAIESAGPHYNRTVSPQSVPMPPGAAMSQAELWRLNDAYQAAHRALKEGVIAELDRGETNARIARSVDWTREYIAKLRASKQSDPKAEK